MIEPAHRARSRAAGTATVKEGGRFTLLGDFLRAAGAEVFRMLYLSGSAILFSAPQCFCDRQT